MTGVSGCGGGNSSIIQQMIQQMFQKADANGDGSISSTEFQALGSDSTSGTTAASASTGSTDLTKIFQAMDTNGDGTISKDEFAAAFQKFDHHGKAAMLNAQEGQTPDTSADASTTQAQNDPTAAALLDILQKASQLYQSLQANNSTAAQGQSVSVSLSVTA